MDLNACGGVPNTVCTKTGPNSRSCQCNTGYAGPAPLTGIPDGENPFAGSCLLVQDFCSNLSVPEAVSGGCPAGELGQDCLLVCQSDNTINQQLECRPAEGPIGDGGNWQLELVLNGSFNESSLTCPQVSQVDYSNILLVLFLLAAAPLTLAALVNRARYPSSKPLLLATMTVGWADVVSDMLFVYSCRLTPNLRDFFAPALFFLLLSLFGNLVIILAFFRRAISRQDFQQWIARAGNTGVVLGLFWGSLNAELVTVMQSGLFDARMFSAPLSELDVLEMQFKGLYGNLIEVTLPPAFEDNG